MALAHSLIIGRQIGHLHGSRQDSLNYLKFSVSSLAEQLDMTQHEIYRYFYTGQVPKSDNPLAAQHPLSVASHFQLPYHVNAAETAIQPFASTAISAVVCGCLTCTMLHI